MIIWSEIRLGKYGEDHREKAFHFTFERVIFDYYFKILQMDICRTLLSLDEYSLSHWKPTRKLNNEADPLDKSSIWNRK